MKEEQKKIKCDLIVRGTAQANANAKADLEIPDPDDQRAKAILNEALGVVDEQKRTTSQGVPDHQEDS